jgi:cob(I)alamin adenosyltransferase
MRVGPYGILSIKERCEDGKIRHARKTNETKNLDTDFSKVVEALYKIEQDIFSSLKIKPEDITNEKVESVVEELKKWEI